MSSITIHDIDDTLNEKLTVDVNRVRRSVAERVRMSGRILFDRAAGGSGE